MSSFDPKDYWSEFRQVVLGCPTGLPLFRPVKDGIYQRLGKLAWKFELTARIVPTGNTIAVEVISREQIEGLDRDNKIEAVSKLLPIACEIHPGRLELKVEKKSFIKVEEVLAVTNFDKNSWPSQHIWLATRLVALKCAFLTGLKELESQNR